MERWLERLPVWQDAMLRGCIAVVSVAIVGAIAQLTIHHINVRWLAGYGVFYTVFYTSSQMLRRHWRARRRREQARTERW